MFDDVAQFSIALKAAPGKVECDSKCAAHRAVWPSPDCSTERWPAPCYPDCEGKALCSLTFSIILAYLTVATDFHHPWPMAPLFSFSSKIRNLVWT